MKFGFISLPVTGHLNPMIALARRLQSRGHDIVFIGIPDTEKVVRTGGLRFVSFGEADHPLGSAPERLARLASLHGLDLLRSSFADVVSALLRSALDELPRVLLEEGIEALIIDTAFAFVEIVPMYLGLPYAQVWNIMHLDPSGQTPPSYFSDPYETSPEAQARNQKNLQLVGSIRAPLAELAVPYAQRFGLTINWTDPTATTSKLAVVSQTPHAFDFPISSWPAHFHYAAPFTDIDGREPVPFPWERVTDESLIYASFGTLVNGHLALYAAILEAVARLPGTQLVLSVGGTVDPETLGPVPANVILVRTAPQIDLLRRAALCVTHAGLNTVLEALAEGVPMVAVPIGYDQPGVAARIAYHGVGEFVAFEDLTADRLANLMKTVLENPAYRDKTRLLRKEITSMNGLDIAADVLEQALDDHAVTG